MERLIFDLTKLLLYIMILLTIILTITILVLSIITAQRITTNNRQKYAPEKSIIIDDFYFLITICIVGSMITILISLYGIHGIYYEQKFVLIIHAILLLVVHSSSLLIGSAVYFDERQIGGPSSLFFKAHYDYVLLTYSSNPLHNNSMSFNDLYSYGKISSNIPFDEILDQVHQRLQCCGLMGTSDYAELHVPMPPSCFHLTGKPFESSCLFKFRLESIAKAQTFAICIFILGVLTLVSFLIDLILLREFERDQLLEMIIEKFMTLSNQFQPINQRKSQIQQHLIDCLLDNTN